MIGHHADDLGCEQPHRQGDHPQQKRRNPKPTTALGFLHRRGRFHRTRNAFGRVSRYSDGPVFTLLLQTLHQCFGRRDSIGRLLLQQGKRQIRELLIAASARFDRRRRLLSLDRLQGRQYRRRSKGQPAGKHLVNHTAQRKQIAAGIQFLTFGLLRRHKIRCACEHPRRCQVRVAIGDTNQTKIQYSNFAVGLSNPNIGGLDVAMDQLLAVGSLQTLGDLNRKAANLRFFQWPFTQQQTLKRFTREPAHRDPSQTILLADLIDGDHIFMVDRGRGPSFGNKSIPSDFTQRRTQHFECDDTVQGKIVGAKHDTRAPGTD